MSGRARPARHERGFTLIELAVVVAIVGLLLGGLLVPLATQVEINRVRTTQRQLEDIRESIYGFAVVKQRLPCPDTDGDGAENRTVANACTAVEGDIPWADLGVPRQDAWGGDFRYRVDAAFADEDPATLCTASCSCTVNTSSTSFALCSLGEINVRDAATGGGVVAASVPAVVVSSGAKDLGTADENENTDGDASFVSKSFEGGQFDDLVVWLSPQVLMLRMIQAERLP